MKKIMHVVIAKTWGGGEQYVFDVCKQMRNKGCECFVVVDSSNKFLQNRYKEVAHVLTANLYTMGGLFSLKKITQFILQYRIDILNCHSGHALLVCLLIKKISGVSVVMFKHNALPLKRDLYHRWQLENVDAYICVSKLVYNLQIAKINKKFKSKFYLVYNGIDTTKFDTITENKQNKSRDKQFVLGYAGRIEENKGIKILLQAFTVLVKKNIKIILKIAGPDEHGYLEEVKKYIQENNLMAQIELCGMLTNMGQFYKSIDLLVVPSIVRESFGLVICEALYCGIPVISTDSGAQKEIIKNDLYGKIVPAGDIQAMANGISDIIEDYDLKYNHSTLQNYIINNFEISKCVDNLLNIYKRIKLKNNDM